MGRDNNGVVGVTPVKEQGHCGSCWAVATTQTVESHLMINTGMRIDLSMQQLADCVKNPWHCGGVGGCQGGIVQLAYEHIQVSGGLSTEWQYPYVSGHGPLDRPSIEECHFNTTRTKTPPVAQISGFRVLAPNDVAGIMQTLHDVGPLAVNVDANDWHSYDSGVYDKAFNFNGTHISIDHVVQLVGWGEDPKHGKYWTVRNSWGVDYGEEGYIRVKRSDDPANPLCKYDEKGTPDGCDFNKGDPEKWVCGSNGLLSEASYPTDVKHISHAFEPH